MILALLLQAAAAVAPAVPTPPDPFASLKATVVQAIRNCGVSDNGEIRVCSRDRGFAEGEVNRMPKPVKPKPPQREPVVKIEITGATPPGGG